MKKKIGIILGVLVILLGVTGFVVYRTLFFQKDAAPIAKEEDVVETLPTVDPSVVVSLGKSTSAANTVTLAVSGMGETMGSIAYEVSYQEGNGSFQGVNSGSKPLDVSGKDTFSRDIYLGTCSRNVCTPHTGVKTVSVVLEFTGVDGKKSQFSKDFEL